jgi:hypothetical protein
LQHRIARFAVAAERASLSSEERIRMPFRRGRGPADKWEVVRYALDSTPRTIRLCLIMLVIGVPPELLILLIRH